MIHQAGACRALTFALARLSCYHPEMADPTKTGKQLVRIDYISQTLRRIACLTFSSNSDAPHL